MATRTVEHSRADALLRRLGRLDADAGRREAVALGLVDALLEGDHETLAAAVDALRDAHARAGGDAELRGWLDAAVAFAHWGLERVPSPAAVARGTHAHDFLRVLDGAPQVASAELRRVLEVDETQVSRTGRRLLERGLATRRKVGRQVFWQITPRGRRALEEAPAPAPAPAPARSRNSEFWHDAIRRGFEAASGGTPREVDPMRQRIIEAALELHTTRGIRATTPAEIAERAGVPVETVEAMFPTLDDLVRGCGRHFMETLQLPPPDRAPDVFAGAASANERIRRLVGTFFGAYERGAEGISAGRRERRDVPALDESMEALDETLDALAAEALRPLPADPSSVASVRALTDVEVWRSLRDHGATPDAAVDEASAALHRWLEGQPLRPTR
ncbi:MAG TPA: TetR family transcriptional regulator [Solirubrobacteraceae bacterium]|jgi:AcrR family transcriptional regulator/DNA-binding MarR family transcriptional regulator